MAKDPAFLFYSKDWLEGTAEMTSEEKGVYIDLLAHQHQKGSLPSEIKKLSKLAGMSESEFGRVWVEVSTKFIPNGSGRLVNRKLNGIVTERMDKGWRNKIIGTLAAIVKYSIINGVTKNYADEAKKTFKVDDFLSCTDQTLTESITEWYNKRLKVIANADVNANKDENASNTETSYHGIPTGHFGTTTLIGQMGEIWVTRFPAYTRQKENDGHALKKIADFIFQNAGVLNGYGDIDAETKALNTFELIADQVNRQEFWVNKSLTSIANHIQEFYNNIKNPINGTGKSGKTSSGPTKEGVKSVLAGYDPSKPKN